MNYLRMFNHVSSMTTSTWSKLGIVAVGLLLMGQSCSINIGSTTGLDGGVFRSDDHGQTWQQKNFVSKDKKRSVSLSDVSGRNFSFTPGDSSHLYLGTLANGIWTSTNGGDQWQSTSLRSGVYECLAFDPLNPDVMYTAAGQLVLKSIDAGKNWAVAYTESQPGHGVNCVTVNPTDGREIWATTSGGKIMFSDDYGQRWTLVNSIAPMQPRLLYIPTDAPGQLYIFTRTNGILRGDGRGKTWTDLTPALASFPGGTDIRQVTIHRDGWFLATAFGLLKSTDRGVSWKSIPILVTNGSIPLQSVAVNPKNSADIFITTDQRLHHTVDGGATWAVTTLPTSRLPTLLTFDPTVADRLYFVAFKQPKK